MVSIYVKDIFSIICLQYIDIVQFSSSWYFTKFKTNYCRMKFVSDVSGTGQSLRF